MRALLAFSLAICISAPLAGTSSTSGEAVSLNGKWVWTQKCDDGKEFVGSFNFMQNDDSTVSGSLTGTEGHGYISGRLEGNKITASLDYGDHDTRIVLIISEADNLNATENSKDHGTCRYEARRS
jgi:hypothetical protein